MLTREQTRRAARVLRVEHLFTAAGDPGPVIDARFTEMRHGDPNVSLAFALTALGCRQVTVDFGDLVAKVDAERLAALFELTVAAKAGEVDLWLQRREAL